MKRQLSLKVLLAVLAMCGFGQMYAIPVIIPTVYTPPTDPNFVLSGNVLFVNPGFHTFSVINNNTYPIDVIDVGYFHVDSVRVNTQVAPGFFDWSANGAYYSVWVKRVPTPGPPVPITTSNGWQVLSTFGPVTTSANGIISITPGISDIIPPGQTHQYAVVTDSIIARNIVSIPPAPAATSYASPATHSSGGVTLRAGADAGEYWGIYPNIISDGSTATSQFHSYWGSVTFDQAPSEPPVITAVPSPACEGSDVTLTATAPPYVVAPVITWYYNGVQIGNGPSITLSNVTASQAGLYSATITDNGLTSDPGTFNLVIVNPAEPTVSGRTAYCVNDQFEPVSTTGQNIRWYTSPTGTVGSIIPPYVNTQMAGSYTFYATQTESGCESEKVPITLTVAPKPQAPGVTSPIGICEGATPDGLNAIGDNLKWYYYPSGGVPTLVPPTFSTGKLDTFSFWVSQTVDGCEGPRARLDAIVTFKPNGQINSSTDSLCQMQNVLFSYYGSGLPNSAYNWGLPDGTTLVDGSQAGPLTVRFDSAGFYSITLQVGNLGCYSDLYSYKVKVNKIPEASISVKDEICKNKAELVALYSYTPTIDTFTWDFDGGVVSHYSTDQGPYAVTWNTPGDKVVSLNITERLCRTTIYDTIKVHELPDARIVAEGLDNNSVLCAGDSVRLSVRTIEPASQYVWTPTRFFDTYSNLPVTYARIDMTDFVGLHVTDEYGCVNADSIQIKTKSCCTMAFPTAFTPNFDGKNDYFHPVTASNNDVRTFKVMNRWGQIVYESADGADAWKGWDGTFKGKPADMGSYFYYINFICNSNPTEQKGEVILIR